VISALLLLALLQAPTPAPTVTATLDRSRLTVGEDLTLTVTATGTSADPIRLSLPSLDGFQVLARSERTAVSVSDTTARTTTLQLDLSALRQGTFRLGPFEAEQGGRRARTGYVTILVEAGTGAVAGAISPRLRAILRKAPPPRRAGEPALTLLVSDSSIYVGEQVDVVTAAWFPRDLRSRLRRPPTLTPPTLSGVWSYPQPTPPGIADSRKVGDTWYDLFVSYQIVFPLVPGPVDIAKASLQYSVPVAMQFFSQEQRYTLESNAATLTVHPLPDAGRPPGFSGAVGRDMTLRRQAPASGGAGQAVAVDITISGRGNVALWPAPVLAWPDSMRHYQDRTDDRMTNASGMLGGTKTFRFLALPDSAGPLRLPQLSYSYFDLDAGAYRTLTAPAVGISIAPAPENASSRPTPPPLLTGRGRAPAATLWHSVPLPLWLALAVLPLALWAGLEGRDWYRSRYRRRTSDLQPDLPRSDRRLLAALRALVPDADVRTGHALVSALRAAGLDADLARRIAGVRDEFLAARYGTTDGARSEAQLAREMDELTGRLGGTSRHRERRGRRLLVVLLPLLVLPASFLASQVPSAESLYESGAYRAASDGFARRVLDPHATAADWYGLGAAEYRLGSDARARAAWLHAARLQPSSAAVRRALGLVPGPDAWSRSVTWVSPLTPEELALGALALWLLAWGFIFADRRRFRLRSALALSGSLLVAAAAAVVWARYDRAVGIVVTDAPMRVSPHGRAPEVSKLEAAQSVRLDREQNGWWLVDVAGKSGWLPATAIARVDE
jgi:hypothetical protein